MSGSGVVASHQLGQACSSTAAAGDSAMRLHKILPGRRLPFNTMPFIEIEADNLENKNLFYARWCKYKRNQKRLVVEEDTGDHDWLPV